MRRQWNLLLDHITPPGDATTPPPMFEKLYANGVENSARAHVAGLLHQLVTAPDLSPLPEPGRIYGETTKQMPVIKSNLGEVIVERLGGFAGADLPIHRKQERKVEMRGSITKIAKGVYRVRVDLGKDTNGKRQMHSEAVRGTETEADTVLNGVLDRLGQGEFVKKKNVTFTEYLRKWIGLRDGAISESTVARWGDVIERVLIPNLGHHRLQKLQSMHLNEFYKLMRETGGKRGKGLAPATILLYHRIIFVCLAHAVRNKYVGFNVAENADAPKLARKRKPPVFTPQQVVSIMRQAEGKIWFAPLMVSAACGLRRGEVLGLRWSDLDLDQGALSVSQTVQLIGKKVVVKATPKSETSERSTRIPPIAVDALRTQRSGAGRAPSRPGPRSRSRRNGLHRHRREAAAPQEFVRRLQAVAGGGRSPGLSAEEPAPQPCHDALAGEGAGERREPAPRSLAGLDHVGLLLRPH